MQTTLIIKILYIVCNREFIEHDIVQFAKENPHAALYLKPRRNRSPVVVAEYCKYLKSNDAAAIDQNRINSLIHIVT